MIYFAIRHKTTGLFMVGSSRYSSWSPIGRTWANPSSAKGHITRVRNLIPGFKKRLNRGAMKWQIDQANLNPSEWEIVKVKMIVDDTV